MPIANAVQAIPSASAYWVALSGGLDSTVLLHALVQSLPKASIKALHVHHGLSANADRWQQHCQTLCDQLGVSLTSVPVQVENRGKGLEDAARRARYAVFEQYLQSGECLLTAHHGDDQVETLLLRLMRGSGPGGLGGMRPSRTLGRGGLHRPLLGLTRDQLEAYARHWQLRWVEDESNGDVRFDRNYLRHQVLPPLRQRWPELVSAWGQSARLCRESEQLLAELAGEDLERTVRLEVSHRPRLGPVLDLAALRALSDARRHNLLRYWVASQGEALPGRELLAQIDAQLMLGRADARAQVGWSGLSLQGFQGGLYLLRQKWLNNEGVGASESLYWDVSREAALALPDGGQLMRERAEAKPGSSLLRQDLPALELRWRQGGERAHPAQRRHSQRLKKLLLAYGLEPWWRDRVPLLYVGDELVAVADLWVCRGFEAPPGEPGYRLSWCPAASF